MASEEQQRERAAEVDLTQNRSKRPPPRAPANFETAESCGTKVLELAASVTRRFLAGSLSEILRTVAVVKLSLQSAIAGPPILWTLPTRCDALALVSSLAPSPLTTQPPRSLTSYPLQTTLSAVY